MKPIISQLLINSGLKLYGKIMHKPNLVFIIIAISLITIVGVKLSKSPLNDYTAQPSQATKSINMYPLGMDQPDYFGFNVVVPYSYLATSDEMLVSYDSQGGMAPPRLILMKGYQVIGENDYYDLVTSNPSDVCIAIWTTMGYNSADDWLSNRSLSEKLEDKEELAIGTRTAEVYKATNGSNDLFVGFLPIGDENETSYFFNTCNTSNKSDLIDVMKSLKLRSDINFDVNMEE